jgi:hypothetical protein
VLDPTLNITFLIVRFLLLMQQFHQTLFVPSLSNTIVGDFKLSFLNQQPTKLSCLEKPVLITKQTIIN